MRTMRHDTFLGDVGLLVLLFASGCGPAARSEIKQDIDTACVIESVGLYAATGKGVFERATDYCIERGRHNQATELGQLCASVAGAPSVGVAGGGAR
jgi:hypothetical protein